MMLFHNRQQEVSTRKRRILRAIFPGFPGAMIRFDNPLCSRPSHRLL